MPATADDSKIIVNGRRDGDHLVVHVLGQRFVIAELPPSLELTQRVAQLIAMRWDVLGPRSLTIAEVWQALDGYEV